MLARHRICIDDLAAGRIDRFGRLMRVSHNGDRVARSTNGGAYGPGQVECTDELLRALIDDLASLDQQYKQDLRAAAGQVIQAGIEMALQMPLASRIRSMAQTAKREGSGLPIIQKTSGIRPIAI